MRRARTCLQEVNLRLLRGLIIIIHLAGRFTECHDELSLRGFTALASSCRKREYIGKSKWPLILDQFSVILAILLFYSFQLFNCMTVVDYEIHKASPLSAQVPLSN